MKTDDSALPAPGASAELFIPGSAGRLEALLAMPKTAAPRGLCVVCHPHPLFGGAMSNKVVYTLASSALKAGLLTLRFNFRGVGRSDGLYDEARGETDDALAVTDWLRRRSAAADGSVLPLILAGFSFGAHVALKAAGSAHPERLISVSIPFGRIVGSTAPPPHPRCEWLAVHSRDDEVVDFAATRETLLAYKPPPRLVEFDGAGHFYHGHLTELQNALLPFLEGIPI